MRALGAALALLATATAGDVRAVGASFDYLAIRAHEGSASGGHAAVRFGDAVFDFQHERGLVRPRRSQARAFQHAYRTLQNRSIDLARVGATPETVALLREAFARRLLAQGRQLDLLGELERDAALLEALAAAGPAPTVAVRGAGFFAAAVPAAAAIPPALAELRARAEAEHGAAALARRRVEAERTLRELALAPVDVEAIALDPFAYPAAPPTLARRAAQALAARAALDLVAAPQPLRPQALAGDVGVALDAPARARLDAARSALLARAAALLASPRPDWGEAFLLAAARLATLDASLASGRLAVLDALPPDAAALPMTARRRRLVPALLAEARTDLAAVRRRFFAGGGFDEAAWTAVEEAASRVAALQAAAAGAPVLRVAAGTLVPEGPALLPLEPGPVATAAAVADARDATRAAVARYRAALSSRHGYDLIRRNCVTELFRTLEAAFASAPGAPGAAPDAALADWLRDESERRLGGYVDPIGRANFVPFVSARNVRARYAVFERRRLPSLREHHVARSQSWRVALRESNVLSSTLYTPGPEAGFFVFFNDGRWPLRPVLGALNLGAAVARSGVGLLQLPFDRGRGLRDGLEGALWSLPELAFANVRKGTNEYVPPELRPPLD